MEQREIDNMLLSMIQKHFPSLPLSDEHTDWGKWLGFARAVYEAGRASPASAPEGWKHSCNALCLDGVELWIPQCPHCGKPAPTTPVSEDQKDAERLNYLQEHGATVHLVSTTNSNLLSFVIGGLHRSKRLNLREAIDAAMQEDKP